MNIDELTNIFSYHPPFGDQGVRYDIIRGQAKSMAIHIEKWCPRSREKSLAITKLQECVMMANAAIAIHEVKPEVAQVAPDDARPTPTDGELPTLDSMPDPPEQVSDEERAEEQAEKEEEQEQAEEQAADIREANVKAEKAQRDLQTEE